MSEITEAHGAALVAASEVSDEHGLTDDAVDAYLAAMEAEGQGNVTVAEINAAIGGRSKVQP